MCLGGLAEYWYPYCVCGGLADYWDPYCVCGGLLSIGTCTVCVGAC